MTIEVKRATRRESKLRLALNAPPGGGRTFTALKLAFGVLGVDIDLLDLTRIDRAAKARVLVVDTRQGRVNTYADHFPPFDVAILNTYAPERFVETIEYAEQNGYEVIVLDTLSHEWMGEGGILDFVDKRIAATRNKEAAWKEASALHEALFERIHASRIDVIACFRAKQQVVLDKDQEGKLTVKRFGVGAVAREGWESDFDVACDIQPEGQRLSVVKSHFPGLTGLVVEKPGFAFAQALLRAAALGDGHAAASELMGVGTVPIVARAAVANTPADPIQPGVATPLAA